MVLPGLVDRLLGGQQNRRLFFQSYLLGELGRANGRVDYVAHGKAAGDSGREAELCFGGAAPVQSSREEHARMRAGRHQVDAYRSGSGDRLIFRIGDDHADGRRPARQIRLLSQNVDYGRAEDFGDRLGALHCGVILIGVLKTITDAVPHDVVDRWRCRELDVLTPRSGAGRDLDAPLRASQDRVFGIEHFHRELARAGVQAVEGNGDV